MQLNVPEGGKTGGPSPVVPGGSGERDKTARRRSAEPGSRIRLKQALIDVLDEKHFDQISVSELCKRAGTSRVTFYTWYDDKYELLDDYFKDMLDEATGRFEELQQQNNPGNDAIGGYRNLLDAILDLHVSHYGFFGHAEREDDQNLYYRYYWHVLHEVEKFTIKYSTDLKPRFEAEETSSFLCDALWGFIHTCRIKGYPIESIRQRANEALTFTLKSDFFEREA